MDTKASRFIVVALIAGICGQVWGQYGGGDGSDSKPFQITEADDLVELGQNPEYWDKHFLLTANIDLSGAVMSQIGNDVDHAFVGSFDGQGHTISNLTMNPPDQDLVGLFGHIGEGGLLANVGLTDVDIRGDSVVGGLAGRSFGTITNCYVRGEVRGAFRVGGLVGKNSGMIMNCYATGTVTGTGGTGGLVGENYFGTITNCYAKGTVIGSRETGGFVGDNYGGTITGCYAQGNVMADGYYSGGLVGRNNGGTIRNCYAKTSVIGRYNTGGLTGANSGTMESCYTTGFIKGGVKTGGFVGDNHTGIITNCFWDRQASGQDTSAGGVGLTTDQMQETNTYLSADWNFDAIWGLGDEANYPILQWQSTYQDVIEITSLAIKPGKTRESDSDSFVLTGVIRSDDLEMIASESNDLNSICLSVVTEDGDNFYGHVGQLNPSYIKVNSKRNRVTYRPSGKEKKNGGITSLKVNFVSGKFTAKATKLNLAGMRSPVYAELAIGDRTFNGFAYDGELLASGGQVSDAINGKKMMPTQFMMGHDDVLRVDKCKLKLNPKKPGTDSLKVYGAIAVKDTSVHIADEDVIVTWGDYSVTLPANNLYQIRTKRAFKYKKPKGTDSSVAAAIFDLEKCTFKVIIKKADIGEQGNLVDFSVQFGTFDRSVGVRP